MKQEQLKLLFDKYIEDSLTEEEAVALEKYINDPSLSSQLRNVISEAADQIGDDNGFAEQEVELVVDGLENKVWQRIHNLDKQKPKVLPLYWRYAAAIMVVLFSAGLLLYKFKAPKAIAPALVASGKDVPPGTNRATLVLANGKHIQLSEQMDGINVSGDLIRYDNGTVLLDHPAQQYLTLTVPKAGKYKLKLSDGTQVWLNAASSLSYPSVFEGRERVVEVEGEAYFEVQHDAAHPFIVKTTKQTIKVLGTAFNINTYIEEKAATTLVHGSVALRAANGATKVLSPGQQAILKGDAFEVNKVNTQDYVAWKEDLIVLNNQGLREIFGQLARWYDVDFVNIEAIDTNRTLSGEIPRNIHLSAILQALEEQLHVKFEINGRRIMIKN